MTKCKMGKSKRRISHQITFKIIKARNNQVVKARIRMIALGKIITFNKKSKRINKL